MYNIQNWYWIVGDYEANVFSSAVVGYVPSDDAVYTAWLDSGYVATRIFNAQELNDVLIQQWLPSKYSTGITISSTSEPGANGTYPLDPQSQQYITAISTSLAAGKGLPGGGSRFVYAGHSFSTTLFLSFALVCQEYVYELMQSLAQIVTTGTGTLPSNVVVLD